MTSPRARLALSLLPALVTFLVISAALVTARGARRATELVDHTRQVLHESDVVLRGALEAETGQRGFLVTGDTSFLAPRRRADSAVRHSIDALRALTADHPRQQLRLDTLERSLALRFASLDRAIALRNAGRMDSLQHGSPLYVGRERMDEVRGLVAKIQTRELELLQERQDAEQRQARNVTAVLVLGGVLAVLVAALVNLLLARIITERELMTRELGAQLGDLVEARRALDARGGAPS